MPFSNENPTFAFSLFACLLFYIWTTRTTFTCDGAWQRCVSNSINIFLIKYVKTCKKKDGYSRKIFFLFTLFLWFHWLIDFLFLDFLSATVDSVIFSDNSLMHFKEAFKDFSFIRFIFVESFIFVFRCFDVTCYKI